MRIPHPSTLFSLSVLVAFFAFSSCADEEAKNSPGPSAGASGSSSAGASGSSSAGASGSDPSQPLPVVDAKGLPPDLTCPGSPGCIEAKGEVRVGVAARTITPTVFESYTDLNGNGYYDSKDEPFEDKNGNGKLDGAWLAGFGPGRAAVKAHDDTWARVLTFTQGDVSVAMVSLDLIGFFHQYVVEIRKAAREKGLDFDHIMVSTTHVHESKDTMGMWGSAPLVPGVDPEYQQYIIDRVVEALGEAKKSERAASLKVASGDATPFVNDTRKPKVLDPNIYALQFLDEAQKPFATMLTWGNHPEALGSDNLELTSDYAHYLRSTIEAKYPGSTAVFFNGCLGGLTTTIGVLGCPDADGKETCPQDTFERAEYVGRGAAEVAIKALEDPSAQVTKGADINIGVRRRVFLPSPTNQGLALLVTLGVLPRDIYYADGTKLTPEQRKTVKVKDLASAEAPYRVASEVNAIELGPVAIGTVPGELYSELWLAREDGTSFAETPPEGDFNGTAPLPPLSGMLPAGRTKIVINNANDALGYIIPKPQWDTKKPYAYGKTDGPQYGEENSVGHDMSLSLADVFRKLYTP